MSTKTDGIKINLITTLANFFSIGTDIEDNSIDENVYNPEFKKEINDSYKRCDDMGKKYAGFIASGNEEKKNSRKYDKLDNFKEILKGDGKNSTRTKENTGKTVKNTQLEEKGIEEVK